MSRLPVFVVNLDRRPDRWEAVVENLGRHGVVPIRIPAIDAETVSDRELRKRVALDKPFQPLSRGAEACILSHCKAWEALLASAYPAALLAEDDAYFAADIATVLDPTGWWPEGAGLIKLEAARNKKRHLGAECGRTPGGRRIYPLLRFPGGSAGYLINRRAAETALRLCVEVDVSIDRFLFDISASQAARALRPLQVVPTMIRQRHEEFGSDIQSTEPWSRRSGVLTPLGGSKARRWGVALRKGAQTAAWAAGCRRRVRVEFSESPPC
ncbi:MAG: glycosyltransferase family 25 protein [Alphaproteobacteria bacterium]|nr:glycosyltransferase family 25 protein [Alphaproteobacteria bacterium]